MFDEYSDYIQEIHVFPNRGVGSIKFGMNPQQVEQALLKMGADTYTMQYQYRSLNGGSIRHTTAENLGITVEYDEDNCCAAIHITAPSRPLLPSGALLGKSVEQVEEFLIQAQGVIVSNEHVLLHDTQNNIVIYPEDLHHETELVDKMVVFKKGFIEF
jgi:hypothetical protein